MAVKKDLGKKPAPAGKKTQGGQKSGRSLQLAVAFWLIFIVIIISLFVVRREAIRENYNILAQRLKLPVLATPAPPPSSAAEKSKPNPAEETTIAPAQLPAADPGTETNTNKTPANTPAVRPDTPAEKPAPPTPAPQPSPPAAPQPTPPATIKQPQTPAQQPPIKPPETRERSLYFTQVDRDGLILWTRVTRNIPVSNSPMMDSLNSLLAGPNADEKRRGLMSLIPANTKIISATVRGNTAYINFNDEFLFNTYGVEGYAAQIRQIVWTATEFSNVSDVQILIEGRRIDYLGEGIWIGSPLSRGSM